MTGRGGPGRGAARGHGRGRRRGRFGWEEQRTTPEVRNRIKAWIAGRVPGDWSIDPAGVRVDSEEILVLVQLPAIDDASGLAAEDVSTAEAGRIAGFREETRERRMQIAEEAAANFGRILSWGATCGGTTTTFTTAGVPVMTRLRIDERLVLDTLVDAGVARSRSEALAWCVRLVASHEDRWISELRSAFEQVEEVRSRGPASAPEG